MPSNHSSHLDTPLVLSVLPDKWRHKIVTLAAADYFFDTRLKAVYFAFSLNAVPIERTRRQPGLGPTGPRSYWPRAGTCSSSPRAAAAPTVGARSTMAGAAWLAARSGRPLVPLHIEGTGRLWPRGAKRIYTGETKVTFGAPIYPDLPARQLVGRLEGAIAALADEARHRLVVGPRAGGGGDHARPYRSRCRTLAPHVGARALPQGQCPPAGAGRRGTVAAQASEPGADRR